MADGSIRVVTKLDNSRLKQQIKELERELKNIRNEQAKVDAQVDGVMAKYQAEREFDSQFPEEFSHRQDIDARAAKELDPIIAKQEELNQKEQQYLAMLDAANAKLAEQANITSASKQVDDAVKGDAAIGKVQSQAQYNSLLDATAAKMAAIEAAAGRVAAQTGLTKDQILAANPQYQKLKDTMGVLKAKAKDFGDEAQKAGKKTSKAMNEAEKSTKKVGTATKKGIAGFGKMQMIMMAVMMATRAVSSATQEYIATNSELEGKLNTLKSLWGQVLGPVIEWVINLFIRAIQVVNTFVEALTGINFIARANSAALNKQAKATGAAAKAAQLAGFDEQTKLNDTSSGGSVTPVTPLDDAMEMPAWLEEIKEKLKSGDFWGAGWDLGEWITEKIASIDWENVGRKLGEAISWLIEFGLGLAFGQDTETGTESIAGFFGGLIDGLTVFLEDLDWSEIGGIIVDRFIGGITGLFSSEGEGFVSAAAEFIGAFIGALISAIAGAGKRIGEWCQKLWQSIKDYFDDYVDWEGTPGEIISGLLEGIWEAIKGVGQWIVENIWEPFKEGFKEAFDIHSPSKKMEGFGDDIINGLWTGITNGIAKIGEVCQRVWNAVKDAFSSVGTWFKDKFNAATDAISNAFTGAFSKIKQACRTVWDAIKGVFSSVGTWFKDTFSNAWKKVKDVFSKGGEVFKGIKEGIAETFKKIVNGLIDGINTVIRWPLQKINSMLNTIREVTILGAQPFINWWSHNPINIPQIPKLALGGIVNRPGRGVPAIIGEAGAEAVLPLENNTEWMDILADKIGGGTITIPITLDGKRIATYMVDIQKKKAFAMNGA